MASVELPTLDTSRCRLRRWTPGDAPALREACGDEDMCRFTTVPHLYSKSAALQWIERQHAHARGGTAIVLAIIPSGDDEPVGMVGLFGLDEPERVPRFGSRLLARARSRGLATSAAQALGEWAFMDLGVEVIAIDCEPTNNASARVATHLGATLTGSRRVRVRGAELELDRYTLTRMPS